MAYPTGAEIRALLPEGGPGVTDTEGDLLVARWRARLEFEPTGERETELAESLVELGAQGDLYRRMLLRSGYRETPTADTMKREAKDALKEYNALRITAADSAGASPASVHNVTEEPLW